MPKIKAHIVSLLYEEGNKKVPLKGVWMPMEALREALDDSYGMTMCCEYSKCGACRRIVKEWFPPDVAAALLEKK